MTENSVLDVNDSSSQDDSYQSINESDNKSTLQKGQIMKLGKRQRKPVDNFCILDELKSCGEENSAMNQQ